MLTHEEGQLYEVFQKRDLLDYDTALSFLKFADLVIGRDYENRHLVFGMSGEIKDRCRKDILTASRDRAEDLNDIYWRTMLMEAQNMQADSYMLYLEKERMPEEKFYQPRRRCFMHIGLPQALQQLLDDELDLLCISLPPGTGKAQPLYSKVLTPDGFIRMGDIKVGSKIISGTGKECDVLGVFPQGAQSVYEITLRDGQKCRCSEQHLWKCLLEGVGEVVYTTKKIKESGFRNFLIPLYDYRLPCLPIDSIKYIGEELCQCIYISDKSHLYITDDCIITHNTTLSKYFASGVMGWYPKDYNLFFSHSSDITRMYYDGVLSILTDTEYAWAEIFPGHKVTSTNAKMGTINIDKYKAFQNLMTGSRGSELAGKVRCNRFLLIDDLIGKQEEALNKTILDKIWFNDYTTDARQRKMPGCKEIIIANRWAANDPIGRLQMAYAGNKRAKFIAVPDIDPATGQSNFMYDYGGMTVEFFEDQAKLMDPISYWCLYKNDPVEREGLLYHEDDLRRYYSMPETEPDAIIGVCDTKAKGSDFMVLMVVCRYGDDYYLADCVCDDSSDYGVQYSKLANMIVDYNMQQCEFESNSGGDRVAFEVNKQVESMGGRCNITTKPTETNKETRILVNADWIKKHMLFRVKENYSVRDDYGRFMGFMMTYSVVGKNAHDDVPDCLANFAIFATPKRARAAARFIDSPI